MRPGLAHWTIIAALAIVFSLRLFGLNQMIADDEGANLNAVTSRPYASAFYIIPHPPTVAFIYSLGGYYWGHVGARIVAIIAGLIAILLTYRLGARLHGRETGSIAAALLTVSFWHFYESIQLNVENIFSLFTLIVAIAYYRYLDARGERAKDAKAGLSKAAVAGILLGLLFIVKYTAVLVAGAIGIHYLIMLWQERRSRKRIIGVTKEHALLFGIGMAILLIYLGIVAGTPYGEGNMQHAADYLSGFLHQDWLNVLSILIQAVFFISPLLLGLFLVAKYGRRDMFLYVLIAVFVIFYLFFVGVSFRAFERFWTPLMPALAIIGAGAIASMRLKREHWLWAAGAAAAGYLILLGLQMVPGLVFPLYPKSAYIERVLSLRWNFYVPFHSSTGPFGFFVQFSTLVIGFIMAFAALALHRFGPKRWAKAAFAVFLGLALAYNAIMVQEYLWSPTSPDVNGVSWEVHEYVAERYPSSQPFGIYALYGAYLLRDHQMWNFGYAGQDPATDRLLAATDNVLVVVDYPVIPKGTTFWGNITTCRLEQEFADKGVTLGYVFDCSQRLKTPAAGPQP